MSLVGMGTPEKWVRGLCLSTMPAVTEQASLFTELPADAVEPALPSAELLALAGQLRQQHGTRLRLGTSSWYFPGWQGLVWRGAHAQPQLSRQGLRAYAQHPLLNTVSLDRALYRPLPAHTYAVLAAQVPADFRFLVKAPALVSDAVLRAPGSGAAQQNNPHFLNPELALSACVQPLVQGLGEKLGVLVLQLSPLPPRWLHDQAALLAQLARLWQAVVPALRAALPTAQVALELRDASLLTPNMAALLREHGALWCLGLHDRMPALQDQLPMLRAMWPADLVCRWNLQRGQRYAQARENWAPFDRLQAPDPATRQALVRVARATLQAGREVTITINNKAEGCAPLSVLALAQALLAPAPAEAA
jgi:uncharacterized protein YecE (DUF72 family)